MLTQTDVNILRMLALGFGASEIASTLNLELKQYTITHAELMKKTKSWDKIGLGVWWQKNQSKYDDLFQNKLFTFDFTIDGGVFATPKDCQVAGISTGPTDIFLRIYKTRCLIECPGIL